MRGHFRLTVRDADGNAVQNAAVNVYQPGTSTPPTGTMHDAATGGAVDTNPLLTNSQGEAEVWLSDPQTVEAAISDNGNAAFRAGHPGSLYDFTTYRERVEVDYVPEDVLPLAQKGVANGVATLDGSGTIPSSQLPALAIGETFTVASQAAMLALVAQRGDVAIRTDLDPDGFFILVTDSPSTLADWKQVLAPGSVLSVNGETGAVSLIASEIPFTPAGAVAATNVQAAIAEVDSEKATTGHNHDTAYAPSHVTTNRQAGSYTLVLADDGKVVEMNVAGANNLTVPPNSSEAFPVGTLIEVMQYGAGQTTLVAGAGVTLRSPGAKLKIAVQYGAASLRKIATNEWAVEGNLSA